MLRLWLMPVPTCATADPACGLGWSIPSTRNQAIGVVHLQDRALCASATNRRAWGNGLHHVLDASTGLPVKAVAATWVLARNALTADGLATALFLTDPSALAAEFEFDYVPNVLRRQGRVFTRNGWSPFFMTVSLSTPSARLQRLLGKMSMYRMLVVLLLAMAAWSFVLSLAGALFYTPAELAATLATAVVSTLMASRVMGLLFRTFPQTDSALITGLLLFFLFWPNH